MVVGRRAHQFRVGHGGAVDADLVGAGVEQALDVGHLAHAAAHGKRDEDLRGHLLDDGQDQVAAVAGGGDVQEGEFVGALLVVAAGDLDGVARVGQVDEVHALDDTAGRDVKAGMMRRVSALCAARRPACRKWSFGQLVGARLGGLEVQRAFVDAAARMAPSTPSSSTAHSASMSWMPAMPPEAYTGMRTLRQAHRGVDVHAREHAVAADVGVDDGFTAVVLELLGQVQHVVARQLAPAVGGDLAVARVQADDDLAGKAPQASCRKPGFLTAAVPMMT